MLGSRDVDDLDLSDDDELDSSNGDAEADALLEEMRKMNAQAAAACATIDGSTKTNDTLADELHTKLGKSVLSIIEDVASGNVSDEAATDIAATSSSQQPSEGLLLKPPEAAMLSELERLQPTCHSIRHRLPRPKDHTVQWTCSHQAEIRHRLATRAAAQKAADLE